MVDLEPPVELADRAEISEKLSQISSEDLKKVLDSKISVNSNDSTEFDVAIFDEDGIFSKIDEKIAKGRNRDLLSHPLVEAFLLAKWDTKIKKSAYLNTIGYFLFIINLTFLLYLVQFDIAGM